VPVLGSGIEPVFNPKPNNLDRRFRIYRETLSRFSCAASVTFNNLWLIINHYLIKFIYFHQCWMQH
ncbi:hypothetical protein ACTMNS_00500, partial [Staphylococcus haemolyticus]